MFGNLAERLFGSKQASNSRAKSRLHFVLVQDRTGLTGDAMARFKEELVGVMERYFVIDKGGLDIAYERERGTTTLLINSPVVVRRQEAQAGQVGARHNNGNHGNGKQLRKKRKRRPLRQSEAPSAL